MDTERPPLPPFTKVEDAVAYYFSSGETMKQFAAAPEAFISQYAASASPKV